MTIDRFKYGIARVIRKVLSPNAILNSTFGRHSSVGNLCQVVNSDIGDYSFLSYRCAVVNTEIGSFCSIASGTVIGGAGHPLDWASTSPVFQNVSNACKYHFAQIPYSPYVRTVIGNDVWIGSNCLIKAGIKIGNGAVVGMGSVVTHDVPPYAIVAGNPAKLIRYRFDEETIARLLATDWYHSDETVIKKYGQYADDVQIFIECFENEKGDQEK